MQSRDPPLGHGGSEPASRTRLTGAAAHLPPSGTLAGNATNFAMADPTVNHSGWPLPSNAAGPASTGSASGVTFIQNILSEQVIIANLWLLSG